MCISSLNPLCTFLTPYPLSLTYEYIHWVLDNLEGLWETVSFYSRMDVARLIAPRQRKIMKKTMGTSGLEPLLTFDNETDNNTSHSPAAPNRIIPRNRRAGCFVTDIPLLLIKPLIVAKTDSKTSIIPFLFPIPLILSMMARLRHFQLV